MPSKPVRILVATASVASLFTYATFRRDLAARRADIAHERRVAETAAGTIEYAERGAGAPMLVIHGAGGGFDQGLVIAEDVATDHRVIAPSRFGYLGTPAPADFSPTAQADAHAALLDHLGVDRAIVVAASAGAPSAIELALRHPGRVAALILLVPRAYHPTQSVGADRSVPSQTVLRLIEASADFLFWLAMRTSRASVVRFFGVPPDVEGKASGPERERVSRLMKTTLPLSGRVRGIELDGMIEIAPWPLERIAVPTLVISAADDLYGTLPGARLTAEGIPGAELHVLPSGGHLMVGRTAVVRTLVAEFLDRQRA